MTSQNNLEIKGNLQINPLAELLAETHSANLSGSFRLTQESRKAVIYLNSGKPVFAASNERRHRLFEMLLQEDRIAKNQLAEIPNFTNDVELSEALKTKGDFSKEEIDEFFARQIGEIIKTALGWTQGEWIFSPLMRAKESIQFKIELQSLLLEHARNLPKDVVVKRFKSFNETFGAKPSSDPYDLNLQPQEAFVLSRFEKTFLKVEEVKQLSGLSDGTTLQILYSLWLGGFLFRENWNPAFSEKKIFEINSAKLSLKKSEEPAVVETAAAAQPPTVGAPVVKPVSQVTEAPVEAPTEVETPPDATLEEYLELNENSDSYYEIFGVAPNANLSEIKRAYFGLAKRFHPDKFHQEQDAGLLQRIQNAFSKTAQAYETLKNEDTRKTYDYKLSKTQSSVKTKEKTDQSLSAIKDQQVEMAKVSFEQGFDFLMQDEFEEAVPFLARAVQLAPDVARYHAFFGKALSFDANQRFKADSEMQTAVKLDPQNATFRIILAEFYVQYELFKRAEGELQRLLAIHPDNKEAKDLLESLPKK